MPNILSKLMKILVYLKLALDLVLCSTTFSKPEIHPGDVVGRTGSITTFNVVIIVVVDQTLKTSAVLFIYFMQKTPLI